jgi:hypothetical protein
MDKNIKVTRKQLMDFKEETEKDSREIWALYMKHKGIIYVANVLNPSLLQNFSSTKIYSNSDNLELTDVVVLSIAEVDKAVKNTESDFLTILGECYVLRACFTSHCISHLGKEKPFSRNMNEVRHLIF